MSGGGGGGDGGGGGFGFPDQSAAGVSCADLRFDVVLSDPIPAVVEDLDVGDVLEVELQTEPHRRIAVLDDEGDVAGAIATQQFDRLLECLQAGEEYEAEVLSIEGGAIRVDVRHA